MALDLPLPRQVLTHAHWTLGRAKMAKSTGNAVNPFFAIDRFGVDTMRYYLAHDGGIRDDADYENAYIIERYKKGLSGGIGNLTSRIVRGKQWSVREAVEFMSKRLGESMLEDSYSKLQRHLTDLPLSVNEKMELNPGSALREIMSVIYEVQLPYIEAILLLD